MGRLRRTITIRHISSLRRALSFLVKVSHVFPHGDLPDSPYCDDPAPFGFLSFGLILSCCSMYCVEALEAIALIPPPAMDVYPTDHSGGLAASNVAHKSCDRVPCDLLDVLHFV